MEWIDRLKPGDKVIIDKSKYGLKSHHVAIVERLTKTQVIVSLTQNIFYRFRKSDGYLVGGDSWSLNQKRLKLVETIRKTDWNKQPVEVLEQVSQIMCIS